MGSIVHMVGGVLELRTTGMKLVSLAQVFSTNAQTHDSGAKLEVVAGEDASSIRIIPH